MRVLLVEDEAEFARGLRRRFSQEGIEVDIAPDGDSGLAMALGGGYDLVLLDIMLPGPDGLEVCKRIRQRSSVPVIMLTARDDEIDTVLGLELGADDYLSKPFGFRELQARIRAVMRRMHRGMEGPERLEVGGLYLDAASRSASVDGCTIDLTARDFDLLWLLARSPGRVFTRDELLDRLWGCDYYGGTRAVDVQVRRVRTKIEEDPAAPRFLHTRWGVGYYVSDKSAQE